MNKVKWVSVPGSKSVTNRLLVLAALSSRKTVLFNALLCDDTKALLTCLRKWGVRVQISRGTTVKIWGGAFQKVQTPFYVGESGSGLRFLMAMAALFPFETKISGGASLQKRPVLELGNVLKKLGAKVRWHKQRGFAPLSVRGPVHGGEVTVSGRTTSQFYSALLLIAPFVSGTLKIDAPKQFASKSYVQMTKRIVRQCTSTKRSLRQSSQYHIPPDASSAVYFWALAAITGQSIGVLGNFTGHSVQAPQPDLGFLTVLKKMGCEVRVVKKGIIVKGPKKLLPVRANFKNMPDAANTAAVLSALTDGKSTIEGLQNLPFKESDRTRTLVRELPKLGCRVIKNANHTLQISKNNGRSAAIQRKARRICTNGDHRIAMSFALAKAVYPKLTIDFPECVSKSYPQFWKTFT